VAAQKNQQLMLRNPWGNRSTTSLVYPIALSEERLFANLLGYVLCVDLRTGKLLWRSAPTHPLSSQTSQSGQLSPELYGITADAEQVYAVTSDPQIMNRGDNSFQLVCYHAGDGKVQFRSFDVDSQKEWRPMGKPFIDKDLVYVAAQKQNTGSELHVLAIDRADGKLRWSTHLGTYQYDMRNRYGQRVAEPALLARGTELYVDTRAGAFLALRRNTGALRWAIRYESAAPNTEYYWNQPVERLTASPPQLHGSMALFKGLRSDRLVAVDTQQLKVLWQRPVSRSAMLIGVDDRRVYMGGEELTAYDRESRKLLWSCRVPLGTEWARPALSESRIYQFTPRGVFEVDKDNGRVVRIFRGHDLDSVGGLVLLRPTILLTVSNLAITAYPTSPRDDVVAGSTHD
jgi:outer membrane protein assembly factor BamB